jgi:hypothetical protein
MEQRDKSTDYADLNDFWTLNTDRRQSAHPARAERQEVKQNSLVESGGRPWQSGQKVNNSPTLEDYMPVCFTENGHVGQEAHL